MAISQTEQIDLTCPACGTRFAADVWTLVDAAERPDLAQALRDETLDAVACPACGERVIAQAPLLLHDPANRRVYFAVPGGTDEHAWRQQAQELLYALVAAIPEEQRQPYLGDVQVEHEVAGVRRALLRRERGRKSAPPSRTAAEAPAREPAPPPAHPPAAAPDESLLEAVRALLAADSESDFRAIVAANPELLADAGDAAVRQLADLAYGQGHPDIAAALRELRAALGRMRAGQPPTSDQRIAETDRPPEPPAESALSSTTDNAGLSTESLELGDAAYQALLQAASAEELLAATRDYPSLLETWAGDELAARVDAALDEGNERLARAIEARGEELAALRARLGRPEALAEALQALTSAAGEDAIADALARYPILLTEAAQQALAELAAGARERGDHGAADLAETRRELLRTVRAGIEES